MADGGLGDLVEHHAVHGHAGFDGRLQVLDQMPTDGLALAVLVRRQIHGAGLLHQLPQLLDHLGAALGELVRGLEVVVDVDGQSLGGKVGHVTDGGADVVLRAQERRDGLGLGG